MKNSFGNSLIVTLFGESHGEYIGAVLDGMAPGISVDTKRIESALAKRRPNGLISTGRAEPDSFKIISGVKNSVTTGAPLTVLIENTDINSCDYNELQDIARPGHCDYPLFVKSNGYADIAGGGHLSGRLTAPLVALSAIIEDALFKKGITVASHIERCGNVYDGRFSFESITDECIGLKTVDFPVLNTSNTDLIKSEILKAKADNDSIGGIIETAVCGLPAGVGEPWFDSIESIISHIIFSVPSVKGIEFGEGFDISKMRGSEANDEYRLDNGKIVTATNHNGGVTGGITNGMPIVFRTAIKPTPSIAKVQNTVNMSECTEATVSVSGRHDPSIVPRAVSVIDAVTTLAVADILVSHFGTDWLSRGE